MDKEKLATEIKSQTDAFDLKLSPTKTKLLAEHLSLVLEKNKELNLTRITNEKDAVILHTLDSLLPLCIHMVAPKIDELCLDFGSGAGFPGLPLAICTESRWLLDESIQKKAAALETFVRRLALQERVSVAADRVEELGNKHKGEFSYIFARAVAELPVLLEYASPLLKQDALFIALKGRLSEQEYKEGLICADICGMELVSRETFMLPKVDAYREILCYKKIKEASIDLPRRPGMAKKRPLSQR